MPTITLHRNLGDGPLDLTLVAGDTTNILIRCTNNRNAAVHFRVTAGAADTTCGVYLSNEGDIAKAVNDATASAAMAPIATVRLYERGVDTSYIIFSLVSAAGATMHITHLPSGEAAPGTTYVDSQALSSGSGAPSKTVITNSTGTTDVDIETAGVDNGNNTQNSLSVSARLSAWTGAVWKRITMGIVAPTATPTGINTLPSAKYDLAPTARANGESGPFEATVGGALAVGITDGTVAGAQAPASIATTIANTAFILNRLRVTAALMASNGASLDAVQAYSAAELTTLTGMLTPLIYGQYKASPTALTEGQAGAASLNSLHMAIQDLGTAIRGEDATNDLLATLSKPVVSTTYSWTLYSTSALGATNLALILTGARQVGSLYAHNNSGAARYAQLFNKATAPALADVPTLCYLVPAGGAVFVGTDQLGANGDAFSLGLGFGFSTTEATFTSSAVADCTWVAVHYK